MTTIEGLEGIVNSVDIPTRATGSKATRTAEAFVRSLIQSSNADAYQSLSQAIADAPVPEYNKITCPLLCVAGQEDQVARLEDLALIGDRHVSFSFSFSFFFNPRTKPLSFNCPFYFSLPSPGTSITFSAPHTQ